MVTVFTPTYNRAHLLPNLYESLSSQDCKDFEWLIVDDGSKDNTEILVKSWVESEHTFPIRYYKVQNGGKMRAINLGASLAKGGIFCGIDSDDWFYKDAISSVIEAFKAIEFDKSLAGVSFAYNYENPLNQKGYVDCRNFERRKYGLEGDRILVFHTRIMQKYIIPVWKDEKFTPESVFIDQMALDGYKMRYYTKSIYGGGYLGDGLTASSWRLLRDNPMGYALMYNVQMQFHESFKQKLKDVIQFVACCCIKGEYLYTIKCKYPILATMLFIPGFLLAQRRKRQFQIYCK